MKIACEFLGHTWVIRRKSGHLIEVCSTCGAVPEEES